MAIIKRETPGKPGELDLSFNNGDLEALNDVIAKYNFVDEEAALRFALIVLLRPEDNSVLVKEEGKLVSVTPNEKLLKEKSKESPKQDPPQKPTAQ